MKKPLPVAVDHPCRLEVEASGERHVLLPAPDEQSVVLSELLRRAGLPLNTRCAGRGLCDGCMVELTGGRVVHARSGDAVDASESVEPPQLRACEHRLDGTSAVLRVPLRSSLGHQPQIVSDYQVRVSCAHNPLVSVNGSALPVLGAAVDIGTTTVALMLLDLSDGRVLARTSKFNEQMHLGDDVLTRINLCSTDATMLPQMQQAVARQTILPLLEQALEQSGHSMDAVRCLTLAGNTTMLHLLAGVDPTSMGFAPFTPTFLEHRSIDAGAIFGESVAINPKTPCHLLPGAAAYVGADLTAGIVATGLLYEPGPSLLVDVGTNGEIILKVGDRLLGCATAAGPAFEGARLSSGMRAADGAVSHVRIDPSTMTLHCEIIGGGKTPAIGVCGSAYVDFLATARAAGVLGTTGRFDREAAGALRDHLIPWSNGRDIAFRLAEGPGKQPVAVSQHDVASLLQAKAAIAAGILTLLGQANLTPAEIKTVYLAGGFGTHMDRAAAIACGLLPGFTPEQICPVGNTSLAGAMLCLMDASMLAETCAAARRVSVVELNLDPNFESCYIDQLSLA